MKKSLFFLFCFLAVTAGTFTSALSGLDRAVYEAAGHLAGPVFLLANRILTFFGGSLFAFTAGALLAILCVFRGRWREGFFFYLSFSAGTGFNYLLKLFFARARPEFFDSTLILASFAYPSGHAFNAVVLFLLGTRLFTKNCGAFWGAFAVALAVGLSRVFLGVHWATDVLGGIFLGLFWVSLHEKIGQKIQNL